MTTLRNSVGERVRAIRKAKGWTQQQLAENSGLDDAYIGSLERGERNFSIDTLEKIVLALQIPASDLLISLENKERSETINEFLAFISLLNPKQVKVIQKILKEIGHAFD